MIAIIQRVMDACVQVEGETVGSAGPGFVILLGVVQGDTQAQAELLARKTAALRIFPDAQGKMNLSLKDTGGDALVISNFTLAADTRKGTRPSFDRAAPPAEAEPLYRGYVDALRRSGIARVETGRFGAKMEIVMTADGPVTVTLNTDTWRKPL